MWAAHTALLWDPGTKMLASRTWAQGCILQGDFEINNITLTVTNIYAPAEEGHRNHFFYALLPLSAKGNHVILGDLNMFPDGKIDKNLPTQWMRPL